MINYLHYLYQKVFPKTLPTTNYEIDFLKPHTIFYGSRKWGGATTKSDVDLLVCADNIDTVNSLLEANGIAVDTTLPKYPQVRYHRSFTLNNLNYQMSILDERLYKRYASAIPLMNRFSSLHTVTSKVDRISIFREFIDLVSNTPPSHFHSTVIQFLKSEHPEYLI